MRTNTRNLLLEFPVHDWPSQEEERRLRSRKLLKSEEACATEQHSDKQKKIVADLEIVVYCLKEQLVLVEDLLRKSSCTPGIPFQLIAEISLDIYSAALSKEFGAPCSQPVCSCEVTHLFQESISPGILFKYLCENSWLTLEDFERVEDIHLATSFSLQQYLEYTEGRDS